MSSAVATEKRNSMVEDVNAVPDLENAYDYYVDYPNKWSRIKQYIREPAAEALGTMLLILFGNGVQCQVILSTNPGVAPSHRGEYLSISLLWACGIALGVWVSGGVSGGHCNPVVTICCAIFRRFSWKKVPGYIFGQLFGAWLGALITYANYFHAIDIFEGGKGVRTVPGTASLFAVYSLDYVPSANCFFDEFVGTFLLLLVIFAATDSRNGPPPAGLLPLVLFMLFLGIGAGWGMQTGYAINPARDLGPRIMTAMVGYGREVFNYRSQFWLWCTICGPLCGGICGALVYDTFIYLGADSWVNRPNASTRRNLENRAATKRVAESTVNEQV